MTAFPNTLNHESYPFIYQQPEKEASPYRGPARVGSQVACRNFKMSHVGVLSRLHVAVGN